MPSSGDQSGRVPSPKRLPVTDDVVWCSRCDNYHLPNQHDLFSPEARRLTEGVLAGDPEAVAQVLAEPVPGRTPSPDEWAGHYMPLPSDAGRTPSPDEWAGHYMPLPSDAGRTPTCPNGDCQGCRDYAAPVQKVEPGRVPSRCSYGVLTCDERDRLCDGHRDECACIGAYLCREHANEGRTPSPDEWAGHYMPLPSDAGRTPSPDEWAGHYMPLPSDAGRVPSPEEALVKGLRKAVADPEVEWVDANIVRLLLDRYEETDRG